MGVGRWKSPSGRSSVGVNGVVSGRGTPKKSYACQKPLMLSWNTNAVAEAGVNLPYKVFSGGLFCGQ